VTCGRETGPRRSGNVSRYIVPDEPLGKRRLCATSVPDGDGPARLVAWSQIGPQPRISGWMLIRILPSLRGVAPSLAGGWCRPGISNRIVIYAVLGDASGPPVW